MHPVPELVLIPEVRSGRARVEEVLGGVFPRDVGEPELALGVHSQPGGVDRLQPVLTL